MPATSPGIHLEKSSPSSFVVELQHDLLGREHWFSRRALGQIRVDQRDDRLDAERGIASDDGEEVFLFAVVNTPS